MEAVFLQVLNMSLTGSYVILAVLIVRLVLKKAPKKYSYALWLVAALRLVCPVSIRSVFSLFSLLPEPSAEAASWAGSTITYIPPDIGFAAVPEVNIGIPALSDAVNHVLPVATPMNSVNPMQLWIFLGTIIWCVGMAVMIVWALVSWLLLRKRVEKATLREKGIYECETVRSPFILGVFSPKIYMPYNLEPDVLRYVLAHERFHIRRIDPVVRFAAYFILTVHWFNPLCWLAYYLMGKDMEMRCDEYVLSGSGAVKTGYSMSLLSIASNRRFPSPGPLAFAESGVRIRIKNILKWKRPKTWVRVMAALLCLMCLIGCAMNPVYKENVAADSPKSYVTDKAIYYSGLSSYRGDDNYCRYLIDDETFVEIDRRTGGKNVDVTLDRGWEDFPFTDEEWREMFDWGTGYEECTLDFLSRREDVSFRYVDEHTCLLGLDNVLYVCRHYKHPDGASAIWNIFSMKEEPGGRDVFGVEDPVVEFAMEQMDARSKSLLHYNDITVTNGEILRIQRVSTGTANEVMDIALFSFDYRFSADLTEEQVPEEGICQIAASGRAGLSQREYPEILKLEDGWLVPSQQTYLLLKKYMADGSWMPMYVLTEEEIQGKYATEEMLEEYGNAYTAAAMELWLGN